MLVPSVNNPFNQLMVQLPGRLILPEDAEYDRARQVWNGMIDKHPKAIARCASVSDVRKVIEFAARNSLPVAIRGGGHNISGNAVCDDGLAIDCSLLKDITVDPKLWKVRAGSGVLWGEFDAMTQRHGLATTGGLVTTTGIAGFTLGGGIGYLLRSYGLACDNLTSAELVTATGELLVANADQNSDLYWALRGGGGNFGVVTTFEYRLHPVGPTLLSGTVAFPLSQAKEVLRFYRDWMKTAPDELAAYASLAMGAEGNPRVGIRVVYNGPAEEALECVAPLRRFGAPMSDGVQPRTYLEIQKLVDTSFPPGRLNYWKANFLDQLSDELIDIAIDAIAHAPSPYSYIVFEPMGGAASRITPADTAFQHRQAAYSLLLLTGWENIADNEVNITWVRSLWEQTRPHSSPGVYVNYLASEGADRVRAAYGINYERLVSVKQKYDPHNFFHFNQNIPPGK